MGMALIVPSGQSGSSNINILATANTFTTNDSSQTLINNDREYITYSSNFEIENGIVCKKAGDYVVVYSAIGSYNKMYISKNEEQIYTYTFAVRGPRVNGEIPVTLSVNDVLTVTTEPFSNRGSMASFYIKK